MVSFIRSVTIAAGAALLLAPRAAAAQEHQHGQTPSSPASWHLMQDAVVFTTYNNQGGPRGGVDFSVQNWWMGMAQRPAGSGTLRFNLMLSLEPATLGDDGCRMLFQSGETFNDR